jgi:hypothetical protein
MATVSPTGQRGRAIGLIALIAFVWCAPAQAIETTAGYELTIRNTNPGQNFSASGDRPAHTRLSAVRVRTTRE